MDVMVHVSRPSGRQIYVPDLRRANRPPLDHNAMVARALLARVRGPVMLPVRSHK